MTNKTEAMDNLIAQDADLIDIGTEMVVEVTEADRGAAAQYDVVEAFARHRKYGYDQGYYDGREAADRIEQLEREKAVVSDLWEQQKEIALDYLTDCNKAADRIEAQAAEIEWLRVEVKAQYDRGYYDGWTHPRRTGSPWAGDKGEGK